MVSSMCLLAGDAPVAADRIRVHDQGAIVVMIAGAITAGATDLSYSLPGYVYVAICAVSTAVYLILIRFIQDRTGEVARN